MGGLLDCPPTLSKAVPRGAAVCYVSASGCCEFCDLQQLRSRGTGHCVLSLLGFGSISIEEVRAYCLHVCSAGFMAQAGGAMDAPHTLLFPPEDLSETQRLAQWALGAEASLVPSLVDQFCTIPCLVHVAKALCGMFFCL
jgi:hypothetical protein